jgi:hypothetical protein
MGIAAPELPLSFSSMTGVIGLLCNAWLTGIMTAWRVAQAFVLEHSY